MPQVADASIAKYTHQTGMASSEQIEQAREMQTASAKNGKPISLCEALVQQGVITPNQREAVEKRVAAQEKGGIQKLGNYRLIKKLGEGGMGAVYLAEDMLVGRKVAVKVLPRQHSEDGAFLSRFRREARSMGKLNHANIVCAFDVGEDLGLHYYVMEYCAGDPMDKIISTQKRLEINTAVDYILQTARGLEHAHQQDVIHRDIKPANLFVTSEGVVKILDLGLSKTLGDVEQSFNTQSGVVLGTPHYISPEQALGEKDIDGRTDIYSLGATFYHLLTGQTPFDGPNIPVILTKHLTEQLCNPQDLRPEIPANVSQVLQKMMAKRPVHRHANCTELIQDLEAISKGVAPVSGVLDATLSSIALPVAAKVAAFKELVRNSGKHDPIQPHADSQLVQPAQQHTWLWAGAGAAAILIIGLTAMVLNPRANSNPAVAVIDPAAAVISVAPQVATPADVTKSNATSNLSNPPSNPMETRRETRREARNAKIEAAKDALENMIVEGAGVKTDKPQSGKNDPETTARPTEISVNEAARLAQIQEQAKALAQTQAAQAKLEKEEKATQQRTEILKIIEPTLKENKLHSALKTLERCAVNHDYAESADFIKQSRSDIEAILSLRRDALNALQQQTGHDVTLKYKGDSVTGRVLDGSPDELMFKVNAGPELKLKAENLDLENVDKYAPKADAESFRRRGLMYLAAGNEDLALKNFNDAISRGATEQVKPYLALLDARKQETAAQYILKQADEALAVKNFSKAKESYDKLLNDFKTTHTVKSQSPAIADSLRKIDTESKRGPEDQLKEITEQLRKLNPRFQGCLELHANKNKTDPQRYKLWTGDVTNITPLHALTYAHGMDLSGGPQKKTLVDISPLKGLELQGLGLANTAVTDLTPISSMKLYYLNLEGDEELTDLRPLHDMNSLRILCLANTGVRDLAPLKGLSMNSIALSYNKNMRGWHAIKDMDSLRKIICDGREFSNKDDFFKFIRDQEQKGNGGTGSSDNGNQPPADNGNLPPPDNGKLPPPDSGKQPPPTGNGNPPPGRQNPPPGPRPGRK